MTPTEQTAPAVKVRWWGIALWLALLWSCFVEQSFLQHLSNLQHLGLSSWLGPIANFGLIVICIAAVLRIYWARPALRVAAALAGVWIPASAWHEFSLWRQLSLPLPATASSAEWAMQASMQQQLHQVLGMDLIMKTLLTVFWLWLCWRLGRVDVMPYFHRRRRPQR